MCFFWIFCVCVCFFLCLLVSLSNLLKSLANFVKSPPAPPSSCRSVQQFLKSSSLAPLSLSKSLLNFLKSPTLSLAEVPFSSNLCSLVVRLSKSRKLAQARLEFSVALAVAWAASKKQPRIGCITGLGGVEIDWFTDF